MKDDRLYLKRHDAAVLGGWIPHEICKVAVQGKQNGIESLGLRDNVRIRSVRRQLIT